MKCGECGDCFSRVIRVCPNCGWEIPKKTIEALEQADKEERVKQMHECIAANRSILGSEPEELKVDAVNVDVHKKMGKPDSIRVEYRCGMSVIREWICIEHTDYAKVKAVQWWEKRFGQGSAVGLTVSEAMDFFLAERLQEMTESITVIRKGKNNNIIDYKLKENYAQIHFNQN
jgi:DNA repair protein RadD